MRKILALLLSSCLLLGLLTGCGKEEESTQPATLPEKAATNTEATTQPVEETEPDTSILDTAALRMEDPELEISYVLLALNPEGPFLTEVSFNETGVDALIRWLMGEEARTILEEFGVAEYGEGVFFPADPGDYEPRPIPMATEATKTVHLTVTDSLESSGILDRLLPTFEETYGYTVEVQSATANGAIAAAKLGLFDLVLTESTSASESFVADGYGRVVEGFAEEIVTLCTTAYVLCGPEHDPAGVADCATLREAFAAIASGEHLFLSRGDDSFAHKLEQSLWPKDQTFGDWYLSVDTGMGALLVMNEFEGGYVLTDKLTWLQFFQAEGII